MWLDEEPTALYRFFNSEGRLLYVGITIDVNSRWADHSRQQHWWPQVADRTVEWFESRPVALEAELAAIRQERPVHNVSGSPWAPKPRELGGNEMRVSDLKSNLSKVVRSVALNAPLFIVNQKKDRKRKAALVPVELGELIERVGGAEKAAEILEARQGAGS